MGWQLKFSRSELNSLKICVTPDKLLNFSECHLLHLQDRGSKISPSKVLMKVKQKTPSPHVLEN